MAKRFTDTDKWRKKFVRGLKASHKLLWFYILDDCDHAGIWHSDFEVASIRIGCPIDEAEALKVFKDHTIVFDDGEKWFLPSFIEFQYGTLKSTNRATNSVIEKLLKYKLINKDLKIIYGANKHHPSTFQGVKDKDKEKEKDKDKDLSSRKLNFSNKIYDNHVLKYDSEMLDEFVSYWTEHGENDRKMRFEKEKVFGIERRLLTWSKNYKPKHQHTRVTFEDSGEMEEFKV